LNSAISKLAIVLFSAQFFHQVKVLFLILVDLCRRTSQLQHPLPPSLVGTNNIIIRLHYIDGSYTVLPEVVEAALGPHMQVSSIKRTRL
jgi:hypothetical protein